MKGHPLFSGGESNLIGRIHRQSVKNLFLQNHWANFNRTWFKVSLGEGGSNEGSMKDRKMLVTKHRTYIMNLLRPVEQNQTQMSHSGDLLLWVGVPYHALFLIRRQFIYSFQELSWAILYQRVIETLFYNFLTPGVQNGK